MIESDDNTYGLRNYYEYDDYDYYRIADSIDRTIAGIARQYDWELKHIGNGWLKPYKRSLITNIKRNSIISKSRKRERKQIFLLKAA